jgi:hypothetical protein
MGRKPAFYVQCRMRRETRPGIHQSLTSWIPEKFAEKGRILRLKNRGEWEDGWEVVETWTRREAEKVEAGERDHLKQREVSDA